MKGNRYAGQQGLAIVEFAIVLPLLLILLLATAEFGRALYQYNTLTKAVRDGARYLSENFYLGDSTIINEPRVTAAENLVRCGQTSGCNNENVLLPGLTLDDIDVGVGPDPLHVRVQAIYTYQPMTGQTLPSLLNNTLNMNLNLTATVVMRVLDRSGPGST